MVKRVKQERSKCIRNAGSLKPKTVVGKIYFPKNRSDLDGQDRPALNDLCRVISGVHPPGGNSTAFLLAIGNTDHRGSKQLNNQLSEQRALSVARYLKGKLPKAVVLWKRLGELRAKQPELCRCVISQSQLDQERRVDIFYGRIDSLKITDGTVVTVPGIKKIVDDAIRIVGGKKSSHPNQSQRLLCYLKKLKLPPTGKNDRYWSWVDFEACSRYVPRGTGAGLIRAEAELRKRARSARSFLRLKVSLAKDDNAKFKELLELDRTLYQSYQKLAAKLKFFSSLGGSQTQLKYYIAVKNTLLKANKDKKTLYSCVQFKHW